MKTLRFAIASDLHGNEQNTPLVEKFFDWMEDFKPDICLAGGDLWNFAALRKKASQDEKRGKRPTEYLVDALTMRNGDSSDAVF